MIAKGHNRGMRPARFAAVNLISDPIHGYIELTKRLSSAAATSAGLPDEETAEEDLLATACAAYALLLGAHGGAVVTEAPPAQLSAVYFQKAPKLTGDPFNTGTQQNRADFLSKLVREFSGCTGKLKTDLAEGSISLLCNNPYTFCHFLFLRVKWGTFSLQSHPALSKSL